jgi:hypothetical protein
MATYFWIPYVPKHSAGAYKYKQYEIEQEYDEGDYLQGLTIVVVRKEMYKSRGDACAHDNCMPCPGKMPVMKNVNMGAVYCAANLPDTLSPALPL